VADGNLSGPGQQEHVELAGGETVSVGIGARFESQFEGKDARCGGIEFPIDARDRRTVRMPRVPIDQIGSRIGMRIGDRI
jgi:hypothetical protein